MVHAMVTDSKNVTDTSAKVSVKETLEGQCINGPVNQDVHLSDIVTEEENDKPEILIIDDNNDMREYLRILLKAQYHVLEAVDGKIGLSMARKQVPDIIICDIMMPVMDGLEFTRALKKDTVTSHIPVILLSARSLDEQKVQGYQEGADSYITKPFQADVLIARINNLLKSREHLHKLMLQSQQGAGDLPSRTMMSTSATLLNESKTDDFKTSSQLKPTDKDTKFIELLRKSIQDNLGNSDLSVEQIGAEIGLSRIQLYRKVKALTGKSPVELIRTSRLTRGRKLIETTDMTISEIAYTVGFSSSSYFTKCFKDEFGIGPNELRV
jgi:DNA-binding response OmpR family regulator